MLSLASTRRTDNDLRQALTEAAATVKRLARPYQAKIALTEEVPVIHVRNYTGPRLERKSSTHHVA